MPKNKIVGISTIIGEFNLGNRLQNYALQKLIKDNFPNIDVKTLRHNPYNYKPRKLVKILKKIINLRLLLKKGLIKETKRTKNFRKFNKNINFDETKYNLHNADIINEKYDFVVVGSDQVWNEQMTPNMTTHLLNFIDKDKRISYAASLGKCELSDYEVGAFKRYLDAFKSISVREKISCDILKSLTKNPIVAVPDPTLTVSQEDWQNIEKKPRRMPNGKFALLCFLGEKSETCGKFIQELKQKEYDIVDIVNPNSKYYCSGPAEFLYLIRNASIVVTDSFHCLVFSIINKKPFVHVERSASYLKNMSSRIANLEDIFKCKFPTLKANNLDEIFNFKIENLDEILVNQKTIAVNFLKDAFCTKTQKNNNLNDIDFNCSGCGLCKHICPTGAISYQENDNGFIYPVIDELKCVKCGKCVKNCSQLRQFEKLDFSNGIYALKRKEDKKGNYSSTGIFGELAKQVLNEDGVVFGVKYDKDNSGFVKIEKLEDLKTIEGSKYFQVNISNIYKEVEKSLKENKKVLIGATPCQIAGLKNKFGDNKNLILVQVLCHGVPSQKVFKQFTKEYYGEIPDNINFRYRKELWDNFYEKYDFKNKSEIVSMKDDIFMKAFLCDFSLNDCCYDCHFAGNKTGADIIIGDCWGIKDINKKFYSENGVSILTCVTSLGTEYFEKINESFEIYKITKFKYKYCNTNLFKAFDLKKKYNNQFAFYEGIKHNNVEEVVRDFTKEKQQSNSFKAKLKHIIKKILKI